MRYFAAYRLFMKSTKLYELFKNSVELLGTLRKQDVIVEDPTAASSDTTNTSLIHCLTQALENVVTFVVRR